ncbi:hypothetical protein [Mycolicibacterium fortuitum]|uniref:hypothetical protein n=1 Tax=Mycolicibacterium fortuitum TaxID=1766 RepID=UPI0007EA9A9C|nr:hypothetical protein [Mycolicibacterium fortuitum]OBB23762.1 hypothetical protein A5763_19720 [Mycolicibacterium fortuitum]OBB43111.1 hypothetical protein A5754_13045 [Mycolicibacterium fortuitum]OBB64704.1 hypothetical protein A5755_21075 [Mycolicibacterium fortuitum]OBF81954.1 hypothetical protein A5751_15635 [Mycolicibacterium fortuitum]OBG09906.1 hypothetical protein A5768_14775 [Mycolicibacterium fortuitum]
MTTPITDKRRAAHLLLACLDDDGDTVDTILNAANREPGGLQGLLAALASGCIELMMSTAGEDGARKTLNMILLDTSFHAQEPDNG